MSWDLMVFKLNGQTPEKSLIEREPECALGSAKQIREAINGAIGAVDWTDPSWGVFDNGEFSIEFNVGHDDPIKSMMLHVRGTGDALTTIMKFVIPAQWTVFDCSTDAFIDPDNPSSEGWHAFQAFRDSAMSMMQHDIGLDMSNFDVQEY